MAHLQFIINGNIFVANITNIQMKLALKERLLKQIILFVIFLNSTKLSQHYLLVKTTFLLEEWHCAIRIWIWFRQPNRYLHKIINFTNKFISDQSCVTPTVDIEKLNVVYFIQNIFHTSVTTIETLNPCTPLWLNPGYYGDASCRVSTMSEPFIGRLIHSPSLVAIGLSVGCEIQSPIGWWCGVCDWVFLSWCHRREFPWFV